MRQQDIAIDNESLKKLEDRLRRGIPKWEQQAFIEMVVPRLLERIRKYEQRTVE